MDSSLEKRIRMIEDVLNSGTISSKGYDSTQEPFMVKDNKQEKFTINFDSVVDLPEGLNQNIALIYKILGDPEREVYIKDWIIMSLNKVTKIYKEYCNGGQTGIVDIAFTYLGMGHINVMSCDLETHNILFHRDGGSNGWDRDANFKETIEMKPNDVRQYYFTDWFNKLDSQFINHQ